jgi:signal-transduction protein with cAMP-binding, CBS, and nucleotidyltransferase domain
MKLKKILGDKTPRLNLVTVSPDASLQEVAQILCAHGIGALMVVEPDTDPPHYVGILSERDMLKFACTGNDFKTMKAADIMTRDMIIATSEDDVDYVMQLMSQKHIRHIPVLEGPIVIGMLSIRDMIDSVLKQQKIQIRHMSDYTGSYGNQVF